MTSRSPRTRTASRLLLESGLIVFSILLAFLLNEWREDRRTHQAVQLALDSFRAELESNRRAIEEVLPYHERIASELTELTRDPDRLAEIARQPLTRTLAAIAPEGLRPPDLRTVAWETALARGTLANLDFATTSMLAGTYQLQRAGVSTTWPRIVAVMMDPSFFDVGRTRETLLFAHLAMGELVAQERFMLHAYATALEQLPH